ncbi:MAG TPA: hypothetical protein VFW75_11970 [Acetobacteraceae bacterium]|nr:hypothetical protein [Acetobacteraceae bacterium]
MVIDAEEEFDWQQPIRGVPATVQKMDLSDLHAILSAYGAVPTFLVTYPVLQDDSAVAALRARRDRGDCRLGVQLHTWVNPPFEETADRRNSFATNLPPDLEERKLHELIVLFQRRMGESPVIFKAGRYGMSPATPRLLERYGFLVDTSLAPRTSYLSQGGPDLTHYEYGPFWFGSERPLLELPLCRSIVGWGGGGGARLQQRAPLPFSAPIRSVLSGLRCAERITLSPEGNDCKAMIRLTRSLLKRGQNVLVLSFHSSSLSIGRNPYVRSRGDVHMFYDRLSAALHAIATRLGIGFLDTLQLWQTLRAG